MLKDWFQIGLACLAGRKKNVILFYGIKHDSTRHIQLEWSKTAVFENGNALSCLDLLIQMKSVLHFKPAYSSMVFATARV